MEDNIMNIAGFVEETIVDGLGIRDAIYVSRV